MKKYRYFLCQKIDFNSITRILIWNHFPENCCSKLSKCRHWALLISQPLFMRCLLAANRRLIITGPRLWLIKSSLIRYQNQKILEFISNLKRKMSYLISESLLIDSISFSQAICLHATSRKQSHYNSLHDKPCYWYNFEVASRPILENDMHVLQRFMNFKNNMTLFFHV